MSNTTCYKMVYNIHQHDLVFIHVIIILSYASCTYYGVHFEVLIVFIINRKVPVTALLQRALGLPMKIYTS